MKIIVDTCIWSLALRRSNSAMHPTTHELKKLIEDSRVQMVGVIRQELLSGIVSSQQFLTLKTYLASFSDLLVTSEDYELAAEYFNQCRAKGIQGSAIDFLICAIALRNDLPIFTLDKDFESYALVLPLTLHAKNANSG